MALQYQNQPKMKIFRILSLVIFLLPFMCSCNNNKSEIPEGPEIISFSLDNEEAPMLRLKIKKLIQLEYTENSTIGYIFKLVLYKDKYYILDPFSSKAAFVFDSNGKFINKTKLGQGPGELPNPFSMFIDKQNNQILIYDQMKSAIVTFDTELNYLEEKDIGRKYILDFAKIQTDTFLIRHRMRKRELPEGSEDYVYSFYTENFEKVKHFDLILKDNTYPSGMSEPFSITNNEVLFISAWNYNVYSLVGDSISVKYVVDFGEYNFSNEDMLTLPVDEMNQQKYDGLRVANFNSLIKTDNYLVLSSFVREENMAFFHSFKTGNGYNLDDCIKKGLIPQCHMYGSLAPNTFYAVVKPEDLLEFDKSNKLIPGVEVTIDDNPYIIIFEISEPD